MASFLLYASLELYVQLLLKVTRYVDKQFITISDEAQLNRDIEKFITMIFAKWNILK